MSPWRHMRAAPPRRERDSGSRAIGGGEPPERARLVRAVAAAVLSGVALRLALLLAAGELEPWADEGQYLYQALAWNHFGFYLGSPGWVWPPGYPWFLAQAFRLFGEQGILAAKLAQVALSSVVGVSVAGIAHRLFLRTGCGWRAAVRAAWIWALYLPFAAYTHYLWPETLFAALLLPAVWLFLAVVLPRGGTPRPPALALSAVGLLLGGTLLLKEATLPLFAFLPMIALATPAAGTRAERLAGALALVLGGAVVVTPWTLRNHEVYGRLVPSGSTLGENLYQGVNAHYVNFDHGGADRIELSTSTLAYRLLAAPPAGVVPWPRSEAANTIDRTSENAERARAFALEHPSLFLRSRLKKLADWVSPLGFFVRHQRNGVYQGLLASAPVRIPLVLLCVLGTAWLLWRGLGGVFTAVPSGAGRWTLCAVAASFLAGALVVSMSRYRLQVEPLLIASAAGALVRARTPSAAERRLARVALAVLCALWLIDLEEVLRNLWRVL